MSDSSRPIWASNARGKVRERTNQMSHGGDGAAGGRTVLSGRGRLHALDGDDDW